MGASHGDPGGYLTCPEHGISGEVIVCDKCLKEIISMLKEIKSHVIDNSGWKLRCYSYSDVKPIFDILSKLEN